MVGIFDPACQLIKIIIIIIIITVAPMDEGTILVYCCPPSQTKYTVYTDSVWLWGGGVGGVELCCRPYSAGVLHSVSDQIQNLQNC